MSTTTRGIDVYKAITAVALDLSKEGIAKDRNNEQQRFKFRGIDDVYNALSPLLAKHGLCILPRMVERDMVEKVAGSGKPLFFVTVTAEFDFVAASDGSCHVVRTYGEAMDMADKATNKAMSAAYKYAAFQAFAIPTEGDNDADSTTHDVGGKSGGAAGGKSDAAERSSAGKPQDKPQGTGSTTAGGNVTNIKETLLERVYRALSDIQSETGEDQDEVLKTHTGNAVKAVIDIEALNTPAIQKLAGILERYMADVKKAAAAGK